MKKRIVPAVVIVLVLAGVIVYRFGRSVWFPVYRKVRGNRTVAEAVARYGPAAEARLKPHFDRAGVAYPPQRLTFLAFKAEKRLELWTERDGAWVFVRSYPILAASGGPGPKLREGDRQVPEGLYRIASLNPNSSYHLSMELDYPNAFDRQKAREDGRTNLGGEIFIHGKAVSIGCLAMGDEAVEELFVLVERAGRSRVTVLIAPNDPRGLPVRGATQTGGAPLVRPADAPPWIGELHEALTRELAVFAGTAAGSG